MSVSTLHDLTDAATAPRVVLKIGSSLLVDGEGRARGEWLESIAREIADLRRGGQAVIVVSSGAIALGASRLGLERGGRGSLADAQAAASVGQIALASLWSDKLAAQGLTAAQLLLTLDDLEDRRRYLNASSTLARLLESGAVPVVNENDSVATEEIRFGDNDRLAARVAQAARADAVVLLSDVDGLYDRNPREPGAKLVPLVEGIDDAVRAMADGGSASGLGSGGMTSKLQAAEIAERAGIALAIVNGTHRAPLGRALGGGTGTLFLPRRRDRARKAWLGGRLHLKGALTVDRGCATALVGGGSLLAAGLAGVEGDFARGDAVSIRDAEGRAIAHGLVEYAAAECALLQGRRSAEHAELLGYAPRAAVVHRDHMALL